MSNHYVKSPSSKWKFCSYICHFCEENTTVSFNFWKGTCVLSIALPPQSVVEVALANVVCKTLYLLDRHPSWHFPPLAVDTWEHYWYCKTVELAPELSNHFEAVLLLKELVLSSLALSFGLRGSVCICVGQQEPGNCSGSKSLWLHETRSLYAEERMAAFSAAVPISASLVLVKVRQYRVSPASILILGLFDLYIHVFIALCQLKVTGFKISFSVQTAKLHFTFYLPSLLNPKNWFSLIWFLISSGLFWFIST